MNSSNVLKLGFKSTIIAELNVVSTEQPWLNCEFTPNENFSNHSDFFNNFQKQYSSGSVENWDLFFCQLKDNGYSLISRDFEMVRFIILWDELEFSVRLRGQRVKNT